MENKKSMLAGSVIAGAIMSLNLAVNASTLNQFKALGSGSEVRTNLIGHDRLNSLDLSCGAKDTTKTKEHKMKDGKCGEGKCGDSKKKAATATDSKTKDAKCGEGKCGEGKKKNPK